MSILRVVFPAVACLALVTPASGQQKRALDHADYAVWNRIQGDVLSRDGRWLSYQLTPGDGDGLLRVQALSGNTALEVPRGAGADFSFDGRWLVALIAPMDEAVTQAKKEKKKPAEQPKDSLVVVGLTGSSPNAGFKAGRVRSFKMPERGPAWIAYLLEKDPDGGATAGPDREEGQEEAGEDAERPRTDDGATLVVRDLPTGVERRFEHVTEFLFDEEGTVLYYAAAGDDGAADGVFRVGPTGEATTVAAGEGRYVKLSVSKTGERVAFLTDRDDRDSEAPAFSLFLGGASGQAGSVVGPGASGLPMGWAPSENGDVSFSDSGSRVLFGTSMRPLPEVEDDTPEDERVVVDVWNWKDPYLQPMQLVQLEREKTRTYLAVHHVGGATVQLAGPDLPSVTVAQEGDGSVALGTSDLPYRQMVSWDGRYQDVVLVDPTDGSRRPVAEMVGSFPRLSPGGGFVFWWDGDEKSWMAVDTRSGEHHDLTGSIDWAFHNELDDHPDQPPPYGSAGWTEDDDAFLVYDAFDIWAVDPTGRRSPRSVTEGAGRRDGVRYRYADVTGEAVEKGIPSDEDLVLVGFNPTTKASGFFRDRFDGNREPRALIQDDAAFGGLSKAEDGDVYVFERQTFQEFPDIWVTDGDFGTPRKVTDANPQQSDYLWGSSELVSWVSNDGVPLQGILIKPENFDPSKKYPMMVYFYERMSDRLHRYQVPAAGGSSINFSFYASRDYLVFIPDIPYKIGYPGESAINAVVPGVLELVGQGFVDRERVGVQGHSWGGYQIAYMVTRSNIFRAAEAGAPVSNMTSAYGGIRWGSGMSRAFQYEKTQSRIGGSLWETPLRYIENSPLFTADKIETPVLMMHNDRDGAVPWYQGIEFFSALRRLGKPVWMLNYNGEDHGLRKEHNRKDFAVRMQQFFDHYLKDAPAPVWMEEGVPAVLKGKTLGLEIAGKKPISQEQDAGPR